MNKVLEEEERGGTDVRTFVFQRERAAPSGRAPVIHVITGEFFHFWVGWDFQELLKEGVMMWCGYHRIIRGMENRKALEKPTEK